jgi:hypothetical protein
MPWWSLTSGFEMVKSIAGLSGDADSIRQQLDESNISTNLPKGVDVATKTDEQVRSPHITGLLTPSGVHELQANHGT